VVPTCLIADLAVACSFLLCQIIRKMSIRQKAKDTDFSDILSEEIEGPLKEAAEVSMGTEIAEEDVDNIRELCEQVISISEYRASLYEYLRNRMNAIAPNLTVMVGELVGARLIAHAGSLMSLAKHPASTVQILGAEKALFRALKTKHGEQAHHVASTSSFAVCLLTSLLVSALSLPRYPEVRSDLPRLVGRPGCPEAEG
jgi:RNA processing factor Prp31